jgi:serine/threonine-protein phosphatase 2A regulatory subunit B''
VVLDADRDGRVHVDELLRYELFASYGQAVVERMHAYYECEGSGTRGSLDESDFCRLSAMAEDRAGSVAAAQFWFRVCDVDGDGVISAHDIKWMYDAIWKEEGTCVSLEDFVCQIFDMAGKKGGGDGDGVTFQDIKRSGLGSGIFGLLLNHNDMLLRRSTAEFSRSDVPM